MKPNKFQKGVPGKDFVRTNDQIRVPKVRLIHNNVNVGVVSTFEAKRLAQVDGLDLVEVAANANPPVCQIMDYGKYMYEKQKKKKDQKQSSQKEKEIKFRYITDKHDLELKAEKARQFLEKGFKVRLVVWFKNREKAHKELGFEILKKCIALIGDVAHIEKAPAFEGGNVTAKLDLAAAKKPKEKGPTDERPKDSAV